MKRITFGVSMLAMALISSCSLAADQTAVTTSKDGRETYSSRGEFINEPYELPTGQQFIYNNLSNYPLSRYFCCYSYTISGPNSQIGSTHAVGMPFTPAVNATVQTIAVAANYVSGTNGVTVSVYNDDNGMPGTSLANFNITDIPNSGTCCKYAIAKEIGVAVVANTQYWIVVQTSTNTQNTWDGWDANTTNQELLPTAFYMNGSWELGTSVQAGFAVLGN